MNEPANKSAPAMVVQLTSDELRAIIRGEVQAALRTAPRDDKLLTPEQVAETLNCSDDLRPFFVELKTSGGKRALR